jgi:site-specific DNA recombinase
MNFEAGATGQLMLTQMAGFSKYEKAVIRERTMGGRRKRAEGDRAKGIPGVQVSRSLRPYGYTLVNRKMVLSGEASPADLGKYLLHPDESQWVRFMFERYAGGDSLRQVALALHRMGVPTARGGKEWEPETIAGILRNPVHKGQPTFGRQKRVIDESRRECGLKTTHVNRPAAPEQVVVLSAPAIVTPEMWEAANARLAHNKAALNGRRPTLVAHGPVPLPPLRALYAGAPPARP